MFGLDNFDIDKVKNFFGSEGEKEKKGVRDIKDSLLWLDVEDVIEKAKDNYISFKYTATLHTENADLSILKIQTIAIARDYAGNVGDHVELECMIPYGMYRDFVYPYRNNIEISIKKVVQGAIGGDKKDNTQIEVERFKAVFSPQNPEANKTETDKLDTQALDNAGIHQGIKFQLLDRSLEPLRIKTVGGVFKGTTSEDLIRTILVGESNNVLVEGKPVVDGFDMVPATNTVTRNQIVIPDGTEIFKVPTYIQEKVGGIYANGIGTYLQKYEDKKVWFVYPLTDCTRFQSSTSKKLTIYSVPADLLAGLEHTYHADGDNIRVLAIGDNKIKDDSNVGYMNQGSGFRMAEAGAFMHKPCTMDEHNNPIGVRGRLNYEMILGKRSDGLNYAPMVRKISCNPFTEYSRVNMNATSDVTIEWNRSDPDLIYPGMPCEYKFLYNNEVVSLPGTVVGVMTTYVLAGQTMASTSYIARTKLKLACAKFLPPEASSQV